MELNCIRFTSFFFQNYNNLCIGINFLLFRRKTINPWPHHRYDEFSDDSGSMLGFE